MRPRHPGVCRRACRSIGRQAERGGGRARRRTVRAAISSARRQRRAATKRAAGRSRRRRRATNLRGHRGRWRAIDRSREPPLGLAALSPPRASSARARRGHDTRRAPNRRRAWCGLVRHGRSRRLRPERAAAAHRVAPCQRGAGALPPRSAACRAGRHRCPSSAIRTSRHRCR